MGVRTRRHPPPPTEGLLVLRDTPVHRLPGHAKLVALVAFALVVVATPPARWSAFAGYGVLLAAVLVTARLPATLVLRRSLVDAPFVLFAALLPVVAAGDRVAVGPVHLSEPGLLGGGTLLAKAVLGVLAAIALASTTAPRELLASLDRLRLPRVLVAITSFMVRYAVLAADDLRRLRIARESRGATPGGPGQLAAVAGGVGLLFVRSYERGERVHQAMLARGYDGRMPGLRARSATAAEWAWCAALPAAAIAVLGATHVVAG